MSNKTEVQSFIEEKPKYDQYYALESEAGRIGLSSCLNCGAVVILGDRDTTKIHDEWHRSLEDSLAKIK